MKKFFLVYLILFQSMCVIAQTNTFPSSGNVGIGTLTPQAPIVINAVHSTVMNDTNGIVVNHIGSTANRYSTIGFGWQTSTGSQKPYWGISFKGTNFSSGLGDLYFYTGGISRMTLNSSGNFGIGTQSPVEKLDVVGNLALTGTSSDGNRILFERSSSVTVGGIGWNDDGAFYIGGHPDYGAVAGNVVRVYGFGERLSLGNSTAGDVLNVSTGGNVGIGTIPVYDKLELGSTSAGANLRIISSSYGSNGLVRFFGTDGAEKMQIAAFGNTNASVWTPSGVDYSVFVGAQERMTMKSSGEIGIGTTTPQKTVDIVAPANDFVTVGAASSMGVGQYSGIHFGYREHSNSLYRKSAIVFERTDNSGGGGNAAGKVHILNGPRLGSGSATMADAALTIDEYGSIGIGTTTPGSYKLNVCGKIRANEVKVDLSGCDFVFAPDYKLMSLSDLEKFINANKHLPEIQPAAEMEKDGTDLGELNSKLLQKVEELTLYMIEQNKKMLLMEEKILILEGAKK